MILCLSAVGLLGALAWAAPDTVLFESDFEQGLADWSSQSPKPDPAALWQTSIQPTLVNECGSCHLGGRFGIATLERAGSHFSAAETETNRKTFLRQVSLDDPPTSRLLAKILPRADPRQVDHGGGALTTGDDALYRALLVWIESEKRVACPDCGRDANGTWVAYVDQPSVHWAIPREVERNDWGVRSGAEILLQPIDASTLELTGSPVDFLPTSFCPGDDCDYGHLSASHDGSRLAFECRMPVAVETAFEQSWNLCLAEISASGTALNPRFLLPPERRHVGSTFARTSPFGLYTQLGLPLRGNYDLHFMVRRLNDQHPVFSPDDQWVYFSTRGPDPLTGIHAARTYHGFEHINQLVGYNLTTGAWTRPYLNEGGVADFPVFLHNGNLALHTWNLERTDRHMYQQVGLDGNGTLPVLFGRLQGPNQWAGFTQLNNGALLGITGRRRGQLERFVPFFADHTLGTGQNINPDLENFSVLDEAAQSQVVEFGFCQQPPDGPNCRVDRFYAETSWFPDGRALVAYAESGVHTHQGHDMYRDYGVGETTEQRLASLAPYLPQDLGIALIDHRGTTEPLIEPAAGRALRYPTWVGKRQAPTPAAEIEATGSPGTATLHIADVPVWFSFDTQDSGFSDSFKSGLIDRLDEIVALRVLVKDLSGNACTSDSFAYRHAVFDDRHDHPTHLGIYNSTGYRQLIATGAGGQATSFGDVALRSDRSVKLELPANELLLFQGVDAQGHVVEQKSRLLTLAPNRVDDVATKRAQYRSQCASCHGAIEDPESFRGLSQTDQLPAAPLDQATEANQASAVDLTDLGQSRWLTYRHALRSVLDNKCVSCHSGNSPDAELTLAASYSATANYPAGKWATDGNLFSSDYLSSVPQEKRVPGYDWSVSYHWFLQRADSEYQQAPEYASLRDQHVPIGELAPWDPGYQALHAKADNGNLLYLAHDVYPDHMGRSGSPGGNSSSSFLLEVLTGVDLVEDKSYSGYDHTGLLSQHEANLFKAVIDIGFPYMARCDDRTVPSGPNTGEFWGDPEVSSP